MPKVPEAGFGGVARRVGDERRAGCAGGGQREKTKIILNLD